MRLFRNRMLFALGAEHTVHRIRRAAAGAVVVPDLHFTQKTERQQIKSSQQQYRRKNHQRAVLRHDPGMMKYFFAEQPGRHGRSGEDAQHPQTAEEVQRTRDSAAESEW